MKTVLQIGEGNFLRAFAQYFIQLANNNGIQSRVVICQPRTNTTVINSLKKQHGKYNILIRGKSNSRVIDDILSVDCVSECVDTCSEFDKLVSLFKDKSLDVVISNTTEAGICFNEQDRLTDCPDVSFPGKVTALLYERFNSGGSGIVFLPVELIENNGKALKDCIEKYIKLWNLGSDFLNYVNEKCVFCNTLVDRIVTGHVDFDGDNCAVACEPYASWLIEADEKVKNVLPFDFSDDRITFVDSLKEYRLRKVRILNGAHTMSVLAAYHMGYDIVRDMMHDELLLSYIKKGVYDEIIPTINLPRSELEQFADSVLERFDNPFIDHKLLDISLNSVSKFKARCLGTLIDYVNLKIKLPDVICFSLAALINFYNVSNNGGKFVSNRGGNDYEVKDSQDVLNFFLNAHKSGDVVKAVLENKNLWNTELTKIPGLYDKVNSYYRDIMSCGVRKAMEKVVVNE